MLSSKLFWGTASIYLINRLGLHLELWNQYWFLKNYLNDLLFVPLVLPLMFTGFYQLGLRNKAQPTLTELVFHITLWSVVIEFIGPYYLQQGISDPWDILCYVIGGLICYSLRSPSSLSARGISSSN